MLSLSLSHVYGNNTVLRDINLTFPKGSFTALVGPNGAGKSTLLKLCANVLRPSHGHITFDRTAKRAYLPQHNHLDHHFPLSVCDVSAMGFCPKVGLYQKLSTDDWDRLHHALAIVGLSGFEKRSIGILSGGQFQRLLFARLWLQEADLLILDEPFSAIDQPTTEDLLSLLQQWFQEGKTILTVIHQLRLAEMYIPKTIILNHSVIAEGDSKIILNDAQIIRKAYDAL